MIKIPESELLIKLSTHQQLNISATKARFLDTKCIFGQTKLSFEDSKVNVLDINTTFPNISFTILNTKIAFAESKFSCLDTEHSLQNTKTRRSSRRVGRNCTPLLFSDRKALKRVIG